MRVLTVTLGLALGLALPVRATPPADATAALPAYVQRPDPSFEWSVRHEAELGDARVAELRLVSQTWRGTPWKHRVFVCKPHTVRRPGQALLFITGGSWRERYDAPPGAPDWPGQLALAAAGANQAGVCLVMVEQVPFQPMFGGLREDALIAYTFAQWMAGGGDDWPLLFPMVKSAVRAMDAAQAFLRRDWGVSVEHFAVTGASKRGWTTWLTGAVDPRVNAIAPMVIDVLNMAKQMPHQLAAWGAYSEQIGDYTARGLPDLAGSARGRELLAMVDPWSYRRVLTMPKLLLIGTNDRYWPVDAANLYWDDLVGPKYLCYVPNNGHGLSDMPRILGAITGLARAASGERPLPALTWRFDDAPDGGLECVVSAGEAPSAVRLWTAASATRDFRTERWAERELPAAPAAAAGAPRTWRAHLPRPAAGWLAGYVELEFPVDAAAPGAQRLHLSTNLRVLRADVPEDF